MNKHFDSIDIFFITTILIYFLTLFLFINFYILNLFKEKSNKIIVKTSKSNRNVTSKHSIKKNTKTRQHNLRKYPYYKANVSYVKNNSSLK